MKDRLLRPILLTGVTGQVGSHALPLLSELGQVIAPGRAELDLTSERSIREFVRATRPRWIIHPAAYTAVDQAETDRDTAFRVNADAPRILGEEAAAIGAPVLHYSTDYVFAGTGERPWTEEDAPDPQNVYGESKLAGEQGLLASGASALVFRTSWVYGPTGKNFLLTMLRLTAEREELRIVDDQIGSPTSAASLAALAAHMVHRTEEAAAAASCTPEVILQPKTGIYHAADTGFTSWFGFAEEIVRLASQAQPDVRRARLVPIPSSMFPTPAKRPLNSRMSTAKLRKELDFEMKPWKSALSEAVKVVLGRE